MKPNLSDYPEIPGGCLINENKTYKLFQVYRNVRVTDPLTGEVRYTRETVGSIKNNVFTFSKTYLLNQKKLELENKISSLQNCSAADNGQSVCSDNSTAISTEDRTEPSKEEKVCGRITDALNKTTFNKRNPSKIEVPMLTIVLGSIMSALTGNTGCTEISDAINNRLMNYFREKNLSRLIISGCSHDTVRKALLLVDSESLSSLYTEMISCLIKNDFRVIAADGQAVRAAGRTKPDSEGKHGAFMLMNFYDATNRVCLYHKLIRKKENEISVGPDALKKLNLDNAVVTADAMSCQIDFVSTVIGKGAHYCLSLKGNQNKSFEEVRCLFNTAHQDQIITYHPELEKDHGRIDDYRVSIIRGSLLSDIILDKWLGLKDGSIIKVERTSIQQSTKKETREERFYISSFSPLKENIQRVHEVIRLHWGIENNLHWCLDMRYNQDRMQANNPNYIANCSALNKLALAYLENYRYWLWNNKKEKELLSLNILQKRCYDPDVAMECIACSLGFV
jgi:predicted transposase YbfD/YdcC